jgi:hemerythrin-like domain-containing protein
VSKEAIVQAYVTRGIKDIISEFPGIGKILKEYGIGCGPCTVGICQLKDILEIHKLSKEAEVELMLRIEAEIYPDRNVAVQPNATPLQNTSSEKNCFSRALQILVDEHKVIKRWLVLIPDLAKNLNLTSEKDRQVIEDGIDFIRSYSDRLHHGKEEDILFTYFDDTSDIFQVIYEDHKRARSFVQEMLRALDEKNTEMLVSNMLEYAVLLEEHINKEDEVLFPWLDSRLTEEEKEELVARFEQSHRNLSMDNRKYQIFIEGLEKQLK